MIEHNPSTDWAREPVKASSDSEDSIESFEVDCAHRWRHCDVILVKTRFERWVEKWVASMQKAMELKTKTFEINFLHKNVSKDLSFVIIIITRI